MAERFFQLEHYVWLLCLFSQKHHETQKVKFLCRLRKHGVEIHCDCLIDVTSHIIVQRHDTIENLSSF